MKLAVSRKIVGYIRYIFLLLISIATAESLLASKIESSLNLYDFSSAESRKESQIQSQLSGVTFKWDSNTYFYLRNPSGPLQEFAQDRTTLLRTIKLKVRQLDGKSKIDLEGISYMGEGRFAMASESNEVFIWLCSR